MSFAELIAIKAEARQMAKEDREKPIVECPLCGELLQIRGEIRDCPWGHFRQNGAQRGAESV